MITDPKPDIIAEDGVLRGYAHDKDGLYKPHPFDGVAVPPGNGNGNPEPGAVTFVTPKWVVGVLDTTKGHKNPQVGVEGKLHAWYTVEQFSNGKRINLSIYLDKNSPENGVSSGSYEMILPAEIVPKEDWYSQSFNLWMSGSGKKEFTGSAKWHRTDKTVDPVRIIFTLDGVEWSPTEPRAYGNTCKMRLTGFEYML